MLKNRLFRNFAVLLSCSILVTACRNNSVNPEADGGSDYYPLQLGKYILYDVDSIYWNGEIGEEIPTRWQFRYDFVDTFRNDEGQLTYTVDVRKRKASTTTFILDDVIHITPFKDRIEYKHNNLHFISFKLPVNGSVHWDPLSYILVDPEIDLKYPEFGSEMWDCHYTSIGLPYNNEILYFDHSITLNQINDMEGDPLTDTTMAAHKFYGQEIYAYGVGMVYKEYEAWTFEPMSPYGAGTGKKHGYYVRMKAVEHN